jgi:hypothetical protein
MEGFMASGLKEKENHNLEELSVLRLPRYDLSAGYNMAHI